MDKPILKDLDLKADCRYALVVAISKRARAIVDKGQGNPDYKPVIQAMHELSDDDYACTTHYDKE